MTMKNKKEKEFDVWEDMLSWHPYDRETSHQDVDELIDRWQQKADDNFIKTREECMCQCAIRLGYMITNASRVSFKDLVDVGVYAYNKALMKWKDIEEAEQVYYLVLWRYLKEVSEFKTDEGKKEFNRVLAMFPKEMIQTEDKEVA